MTTQHSRKPVVFNLGLWGHRGGPEAVREWNRTAHFYLPHMLNPYSILFEKERE